MKKTLVLAMAMALGVSATAFAANPFSDLPAGHWAYASVAKLAAAGIVDGYPDGSFKGGNLMTRYEMAQIVAKALAKGAIGADDKLVSEFADELDNLGVRVAKLEKNADNVKVTGQARFAYDNSKIEFPNGEVKGHNATLRSRLWLTGEVNDNWHYESMLRNEQVLTDEDGNEKTYFQRANLQGNLGGVKITAGRYSAFIADGNIYDHRVDAIKAAIGKNVKLTGEYGKMSGGDETHVAGKFYHLGLNGDMGGFKLGGDYVKADDVDYTTLGTKDNKIWDLYAGYKAGDFGLNAMYLKSDVDDMAGNATGYVIGANVGEAKAAKPGSVGLWANYYNQASTTVIAHTMNGNYKTFGGTNTGDAGFKGFGVGVNYTVAKNMIAGVQYYDLKSKGNNIVGNDKAKTIWSQLVVTF